MTKQVKEVPILQVDGTDVTGGKDSFSVRLLELGELLQRTRESRGITVEEAVEATKVRGRYLRAIELGDLRILPGKVYARGFIRNYADYLGLNGSELANLYLGVPRDEELARPTVEAPARSVAVRQSASVGKSVLRQRAVQQQDSSFGKNVLVITIAVVLFTGAVVLYAITSTHRTVPNQIHSVTPPVSHPAVPKTTTKATVTGKKPTPTPSAVLTKEGATSNIGYYNVTTVKPLSLVVDTLRGDCWVQVTADGKIISSYTIPQGTKVTFPAQNQLSILVGAPDNIAMSVNGLPVAIVTPHVFTYQFTRK